MTLSEYERSDRGVLRRLAAQVAEIAAEPSQHDTVARWRRLNNLEPVRPQVWVIEIPWHEIDDCDELRLQCEDPFCREHERRLRRQLYSWRHVRGDMVIEPCYECPLAIEDTGFGITVEEDPIPQNEKGGIFSHDYHPQIPSEADVDRIRPTVVTVRRRKSESRFHRLVNLFGDILPIEQRGIVQGCISPWDRLVQWWGVQEALTDLVLRPELVHAVMERLLEVLLDRLRQWEELNLLDIADGNYRVGSGGLGYTDELPQPDFDPAHVRPRDQWGFSAPRTFSDVSPEMHDEFALRYERRWLERFGLVYYGCCEPLHDKIGILETLPNLRKISASPWADMEKMSELTRGRYVLSIKPNPAILADDVWNPERARAELRKQLEPARGCPVEIIMKDIGTIRGDPRRLSHWADIAGELVDEFGPE